MSNGVLGEVMKNQSLVLRLVRGAVFWALPLLLLTAITLTWLYRGTTYRSFDDPLVSAVTALIATAEVQEGSLSLTREPIDPRYQRALSGRYCQALKFARGLRGPIRMSLCVLSRAKLCCPT